MRVPLRVLLGALVLFCCLPVRADFSKAPQVPALLAQLRDQAGFTPAELDRVRSALADAQLLPQLIHTEQHAKERTLSWDQYAPIHINAANIANGLAFMQAQKQWLAKAQAEYGVPAAVITAVLGVETKYGNNTGHVRVLDALATMGFKHPTRGPFFLSELEQFFVLCRDDGLDPTQLKGSYAGAMGSAQFMPSNYLRLGVDFDGNGVVNLWSAADAIGSIANYLRNYRPGNEWQRGMLVMTPAHIDGTLPPDIAINQRHMTTTIAGLEHDGITASVPLRGSLNAGLVLLDVSHGTQNWITLHNFYSIMSYNPRIFYAMAVSQLAAALVAAQGTGE